MSVAPFPLSGSVLIGCLSPDRRASPTGYKKVEKLLVVDPPRDSFVKKAFELYTSGSHSLQSLKKQLDEEGFRSQNGKPLTKSNYLMEKNLQISFQLIFAAIKKYQIDKDELPDLDSDQDEWIQSPLSYH